MANSSKTVLFEIAPDDSWQSVARNGRGGGRQRHTTGITFHKDKAGTNPERFSIRVRLGVDVVAQLRWLTGDMVDIRFSTEHRQIKIFRTNEKNEGWKLLPTNTAKSSSGQSCTCYFKLTPDDLLSELIFHSARKDYTPDEGQWRIVENLIVCTVT